MNLDAQEAALGLLVLSPTNLTSAVATIIHSPTSTIPTKRKQRDEADYAGEAIDCICGFDLDDGFSIACDVCSRWCHSACFDVAPDEIPDQFKCWTCKPRPASFKERAVRMQKERLELGGVAIVEKQRRKASPGVERKHRRVSLDKRKRRPSMVNEDEHVDIDEPWSQSYVHISQDIISDDDTRVKLRRQAQHWRGVTAVADSSPLVKELPLAEPSSYSNPHILPPAYSLHTAAPISSDRLITDYKSSITPSSSYLSDPLNAYAHLGMPKPFVHLFGPPLDVALDSRLAGNHGRFARSGCRPNAILRPLLCDNSDSLGFGVFALRDLKANEEVVLGWEWDDGNAVHNLPALLKTPQIFPPRQVQHLRHQMSNILHTLSSTFTTCACGARAQDCTINRMAAFVDGVPTESAQQEQHVDLGPLVGRKRGFKTKERIPFSGGRVGMVMCGDNEVSPRQSLPALQASPILSERNVKGKGRAIDEDGDIEMAEACDTSVCKMKNGQASAPIPHKTRTLSHSPNRLKSHPMFGLRPPDPGGLYQHVSYEPENEDSMPPKMRKRWMHRELESLRELNGNTSPSSSQGSNHSYVVRLSESPGSSSSTSTVSLGSPTIAPSKLTKELGLGITYSNGYGHDRPQSMPPPPMPAYLDPTAISPTKPSINTNQYFVSPFTTLIPPSISPLTSFANLSLLSPALLRSTPPPSLLAPFAHAPANPGTSTTPPLPPLKDKNAADWSPLRRHTAVSPPLPAPVSPSSHHNDIVSIAPSTSSPPPQPLLPDSVPLSTSQHNTAVAYQLAVKEEESRSEDSREQPSHLPAPKVKMSLRDFALRKKKQREEEMTKNVQDTPLSAGVDLSFGGSEVGCGPNGIQEDPMGQVDEESSNEKTVELKEVVDSYQGVSTLLRNIVKDEVVDIPGASVIKPTTINGIYHPQPSSSPPPGPLSTLLETRIHTTFTTFTTQPCQEDGEIGEILDTPLPLPSSLPAAPPAMNRLASMTTTIPGTITPPPRAPTSKRADFAFTRSASSSQVRHSPPTHPKSFNASPPYRQQAFSASTPPPPLARGTGVPPTAPRALRQYMSSNRPTPTTPTVMTSSSSYPPSTSSTSTIPTSSPTITTTTGGRFPPYIPRGPSADRDKVRDIDQTQYANSLSRRDSREGGHHAWGR